MYTFHRRRSLLHTFTEREQGHVDVQGVCGSTVGPQKVHRIQFGTSSHRCFLVLHNHVKQKCQNGLSSLSLPWIVDTQGVKRAIAFKFRTGGLTGVESAHIPPTTLISGWTLLLPSRSALNIIREETYDKRLAQIGTQCVVLLHRWAVASHCWRFSSDCASNGGRFRDVVFLARLLQLFTSVATFS